MHWSRLLCTQEIHLNDIVEVELSPSSTTAEAPKHVFEIRTEETLYYIGEHCSEKDRQSGGNVEENGCGVECAQRMAKAIRRAWLPVTSEPTDTTAAGLNMGLARGALGARAPLRAEKNFVGQIYRGKL